MESGYRKRRIIVAVVIFISILVVIILNIPKAESSSKVSQISGTSATAALDQIVIKGRAPKTNYSRDKFGAAWEVQNGCDTRNIILFRDLKDPIVDDGCHVTNGTLDDPYTGKQIQFTRGSKTGGLVQIDHVVALSDAWQKGAQLLTYARRVEFANDPLELLAVDSDANIKKGDGDAATWLPKNKAFRCQYVARQIAVKIKYKLWMTLAERDAIKSVLGGCTDQLLPSP